MAGAVTEAVPAPRSTSPQTSLSVITATTPQQQSTGSEPATGYLEKTEKPFLAPRPSWPTNLKSSPHINTQEPENHRSFEDRPTPLYSRASGIGPATYATPEDTSSSKTYERHARGKLKRERHKQNDSGSDDTPEPGPKKKVRNTLGSTPRLACPFFMCYPHKHIRCGLSSFSKISHVAQHLERQHYESVKCDCPICGVNFDTLIDRDAHIREQRCPKREPGLCSVTTERLELIRSISADRLKSQSEKWVEIYRIIAGDSIPQPLPWCTDPVDYLLRHFINYASRSGDNSIFNVGEGSEPHIQTINNYLADEQGPLGSSSMPQPSLLDSNISGFSAQGSIFSMLESESIIPFDPYRDTMSPPVSPVPGSHEANMTNSEVMSDRANEPAISEIPEISLREKEELHSGIERSTYQERDLRYPSNSQEEEMTSSPFSAQLSQEKDEINEDRERPNTKPDTSTLVNPRNDADRNIDIALESLNPQLSGFQSIAIPMKSERIDVSLARHVASGVFSNVYELEVTIVPESGVRSTRSIAIKNLKSISDAHDLFEAESKALLRLAKAAERTTNIIYLLTNPFEGEHDLAFFLPLAHSNLESYLAHDRISDRLTSAIWQQLSLLTIALSIIHDEKIVHGDLKPDNILVFKSEHTISLKIADFGHSVCDRTTGRLATDATAYSLNPSYSAPELWNRSATDLRLYDVWALGCILLEVTILMRDGAEDIKQFRKDLTSPIGRITASTFHDGYHLKPQVHQYLDKLNTDLVFKPLSSTIRGMLMEDSSLRLTASLAAYALRDFDGINSQPIYLPIQSTSQRASFLLKNSDVSLNQLFMVLILPILTGFFISALAIFSSMRLVVTLIISYPTFWILILGSIYYYTGTPEPKALYSRFRFWLSLDEQCPFPDCPSRLVGTNFSYPTEWYQHMINQHSNTDHISQPAMNSATSSTPPMTSSISLGTIAMSHREPQSTFPQRSSGFGPLHGNSGSRENNANPTAAQSTEQALDLCFPEFPMEALHQWKDLEYNGSWLDNALFRELAHAYYNDTLYRLRLSSHMGVKAIKSIVSFTQLSQIRPTKFHLVTDYIQKRNKAACLAYTPSQDVSKLLLAPSWQRHLANQVRIAKREQAIKDNLDVQGTFASLVVRQLNVFARSRQPLPGLGYEGNALEFVESLNKRKLCLQFIIAVAVSIIAGVVVGSRSGSMEQAFIVIGLGVSLSQLLVAILTFIVPPLDT
ncbi:hypothetical protein F4679DRAFT_568854 [Xylaria curta]|nr:hypothetical protein F4679DRAFT_568854 [Xylaria curta]